MKTSTRNTGKTARIKVSQKIWRTLSGIMAQKTSRHVDSDAHSAEEFVRFFDDKVNNVQQSTLDTPLHDIPVTAAHSLDMWTAVRADDVHKLIQSACSKTSQSNPAPTWLVKKFGCHVTVYRAAFQCVLGTGCFPAKFKYAIVLPLLKKNGLDKDQLKN